MKSFLRRSIVSNGSVVKYGVEPVVIALLAVSSLAFGGCSNGVSSPEAEFVGGVTAKLTSPFDACVETDATSTLRSVSEKFLLQANVASQLQMAGLPLVDNQIQVKLFNNSTCEGEDLYRSVPTVVHLSPDNPSASLVLKLLGRGQVQIDAEIEGLPRGFREDFNSNLSPAEWVSAFTQGAADIRVENGSLVMETVPNPGCATAYVRSTRSFSVQNGTVHYQSRVIDAYVDQGIYGDAQPRGLVGADRSQAAIEFVNAFPTPTTVACRTVAGGVVTETRVDIGQSVRSPALYEFVATSSGVTFMVNGQVVATHTTNVPQGALNVYYGTGDSCAGNVPVIVDWVSVD